MKNQVYVDGSMSYISAIQRWSAKFRELMQSEKYAAISIVAYYLPSQCMMVGCPLGDDEYQRIGEQMRNDGAMFAAAEKTGLLAEGIDAIFAAALDNCDSWAYYANDIAFILKNSALHKYVSFSDRYLAECFLSGGKMLCEDEDLWLRYGKAAEKVLSQRKTRGYAY